MHSITLAVKPLRINNQNLARQIGHDTLFIVLDGITACLIADLFQLVIVEQVAVVVLQEHLLDKYPELKIARMLLAIGW